MATLHVRAPDPKDVASALRALREFSRSNKDLPTQKYIKLGEIGPQNYVMTFIQLQASSHRSVQLSRRKRSALKNLSATGHRPQGECFELFLASLLSLLPLVWHGRPTPTTKSTLWSKPCGHRSTA